MSYKNFSRFAVFFTLCINYSFSFSQDFTQTVQIDLAVLDKTINFIEKKCMNEDPIDKVITCSASSYEVLSERAASNMMKEYGRKKMFFEEEKLILFDWLKSRKIDKKNFDNKLDELTKLSKKESADFFRAYDQKIEEYKRAISQRVEEMNAFSNFIKYERRNFTNIDQSISVFNGPVIPNSMPKTQNYFINGISITCTTINNNTSCIR